jgi:hypothetical protein
MSAKTQYRVVVGICLAVMMWIALSPPPDIPADPSSAEPEPEVMELAARAEAKAAVSRELLAGRLTLTEAAAVFEWLAGQPSPTPTIETKLSYVRAVVAWIGSVVECDSCGSEDRKALQRLTDQLRQIEGAQVSPPLPEVNTPDCQALLERALASVDALRFGPAIQINVHDLRLVWRDPRGGGRPLTTVH